MIPLVCIDVDGTLIGASGTPSPRVWAAAAAALMRGQHLALSTARGAFGPTLDHARRLDPDGWHVFHAGGAIVHVGTDQVRSSELDTDVIGRAQEIAATTGWVLECYSARDYAVDSDDPLAIAHAGLLGVEHHRRAPDDLADAIVRVQFVVPIADAGAVAHAMGTGATVSAATSPVMPGAAFVSVTPSGISKATAIAIIATDLGVGMDRVMMVGDGDNDLQAITAVGHGVAMGNAEPSVRTAARHVVGHVDDDGLAQALDLSAQL